MARSKEDVLPPYGFRKQIKARRSGVGRNDTKVLIKQFTILLLVALANLSLTKVFGPQDRLRIKLFKVRYIIEVIPVLVRDDREVQPLDSLMDFLANVQMVQQAVKPSVKTGCVLRELQSRVDAEHPKP